MLPVSLLIALVLAFGIDPPPTGVPPSDVGFRIARDVRRDQRGGDPLLRAGPLGRVAGLAQRNCPRRASAAGMPGASGS